MKAKNESRKQKTPIQNYNEIQSNDTTEFSFLAEEETFETFANLKPELPFETFDEEMDLDLRETESEVSEYSGYKTQEEEAEFSEVEVEDEPDFDFETLKSNYEEDVKAIRLKFLNQCMILPKTNAYLDTLCEEPYLPE